VCVTWKRDAGSVFVVEFVADVRVDTIVGVLFFFFGERWIEGIKKVVRFKRHCYAECVGRVRASRSTPAQHIAYVNIYIYIYMYVYICVYTCMYVYIYTCIYMCMYNNTK